MDGRVVSKRKRPMWRKRQANYVHTVDQYWRRLRRRKTGYADEVPPSVLTPNPR